MKVESEAFPLTIVPDQSADLPKVAGEVGLLRRAKPLIGRLASITNAGQAQEHYKSLRCGGLDMISKA